MQEERREGGWEEKRREEERREEERREEEERGGRGREEGGREEGGGEDASDIRITGFTIVPGSCLRTPPTAPVTPLSSCSWVAMVTSSLAVPPMPCMSKVHVLSTRAA